jgi:hypothetical protein
VRRKILGYHRDEEGHWVADLECGHPQHVRHQPPWMERPWVLTPEGRASRIGMELDCKRCDEGGPGMRAEPAPMAGESPPREAGSTR